MFKWINKLKNKKGFTLIELIVVLAVLGIIALIAIPRFLTVQETAKEDSDVSSGAMIAKAAELYKVQEKITAITVVGSDMTGYIDTDLKFQSAEILNQALADVTVTFDNAGDGGVTTVTVTDTDSNEEIIYPEISHTLGND
jgi:type IV pilus assembly protein PilA